MTAQSKHYVHSDRKKDCTKPSMIARDKVEEITGFAPGGVCPFNVPKDIPVWLDVSMKRFEYIYPAGGNEFTYQKFSVKNLFF